MVGGVWRPADYYSKIKAVSLSTDQTLCVNMVRWITPILIFTMLKATYEFNFNYTTASLAKEKFEKNFLLKCAKYPFVDAFKKMLQTPPETYLIYVYQEPGQGGNGGLGDRLAGMITALSFALRSNRTFLVVGDDAFEKAFQPYHDTSNHFNRGRPSWWSW